MVFFFMRALTMRTHARVAGLRQVRQPRGLSSSILLLSTRPVAHSGFSSAAIKPLLRPGVGQLRQASVTLSSSLFGDSTYSEQSLGGRWLRLRTGEHSRHHDPRGELLRQYASSHAADNSLGLSSSAAAAPQSDSAADNGSSSSTATFYYAEHEQQREQAGGNNTAASAPGVQPGHSSHHPHHHQDGHHHNGGHHHGSSPNCAPVPEWKQRLGRFLESDECHRWVITLVMLDLTIVVTELILGSLFTHGSMPHAVHVAEEILSWSSIGILGLFGCELLAKLVCFGSQYFAHSRWHLLDAVVVTLSLCLELALKGVAQEAASLLMFFRLWKYTPEFLRVARHAPEAAEIARVARHSPEVVRILSHTPEFLRAFRHSPEVARVARHIPEVLRVFRHVPEFFRFARHTPELFRLWRVARIAHGAAAAMELHSAKEAEEQRHLLTRLQKDLAVERERIQLLEAEVMMTKQYLTPEQQEEVAASVLKMVRELRASVEATEAQLKSRSSSGSFDETSGSGSEDGAAGAGKSAASASRSSTGGNGTKP